uniref:Receptor ligand binding region domain-containing protein n=1 Tax=Panagrolaimus davidi TaxID=227884 RepID=A0A914P7J2_9BILA
MALCANIYIIYYKCGSPPPSTILPQSTLLPTQPTPTFSLIRDTVKRFQNSRPNSPKQQQFISRRHELPYHVILVLPAKESNNDKFGLTIEKARAVIDIAVEDVIKSGIMPKNWINLTVHDSRYWEDTSLAERWSTTGVVKAYCERRLDAIFGFADSYSLATVAKVSAGFGNGIPVFTTAGLTSQIGSKKDFPFLTRMQGSYRQMADSVYQLIAYHPPAEATTTTTTTTTSTTLKPSFNVSSNLNYQNLVFMYHDKRRAMNRPQASKTGEVQEQELSSHCFFAVYAIKHYFAENSEYFKESWQIQTPAVAFDEELNRTKEDVSGWLKVVSQYANVPQKV